MPITKERYYHDAEGNPCTLEMLCVKEPRWAATRVRMLCDDVDRLEEEVERLRPAQGKPPGGTCQHVDCGCA